MKFYVSAWNTETEELITVQSNGFESFTKEFGHRLAQLISAVAFQENDVKNRAVLNVFHNWEFYFHTCDTPYKDFFDTAINITDFKGINK